MLLPGAVADRPRRPGFHLAPLLSELGGGAGRRRRCQLVFSCPGERWRWEVFQVLGHADAERYYQGLGHVEAKRYYQGLVDADRYFQGLGDADDINIFSLVAYTDVQRYYNFTDEVDVSRYHQRLERSDVNRYFHFPNTLTLKDLITSSATMMLSDMICFLCTGINAPVRRNERDSDRLTNRPSDMNSNFSNFPTRKAADAAKGYCEIGLCGNNAECIFLSSLFKTVYIAELLEII